MSDGVACKAPIRGEPKGDSITPEDSAKLNSCSSIAAQSLRAKWASLPATTSFTLLEAREHLEAFDKLVLWEGAQEIEFSLVDD